MNRVRILLGETWVRRSAAALLVVALVITAYGALDTHLAPPSDHGLDKVVHTGAFAALGFLAALAAAGGRRLVIGGLGLVAFALALELAQALINPARHASLADALASVAGVLLGAGIGFWSVRESQTRPGPGGTVTAAPQPPRPGPPGCIPGWRQDGGADRRPAPRNLPGTHGREAGG